MVVLFSLVIFIVCNGIWLSRPCPCNERRLSTPRFKLRSCHRDASRAKEARDGRMPTNDMRESLCCHPMLGNVSRGHRYHSVAWATTCTREVINIDLARATYFLLVKRGMEGTASLEYTMRSTWNRLPARAGIQAHWSSEFTKSGMFAAPTQLQAIEIDYVQILKRFAEPRYTSGFGKGVRSTHSTSLVLVVHANGGGGGGVPASTADIERIIAK